MADEVLLAILSVLGSPAVLCPTHVDMAGTPGSLAEEPKRHRPHMTMQLHRDLLRKDEKHRPGSRQGSASRRLLSVDVINLSTPDREYIRLRAAKGCRQAVVGKRTQTRVLCLLESVTDVRKATFHMVWRQQLQPDFYIFDTIYLYWESYSRQKTFCLLVGAKWGISNGMWAPGEELGTIGQMEGTTMLHGARAGAIKSQMTVHVTVMLRQCPQ